MAAKACSSCGVHLTGVGTAVFLCPACGEAEIGRCATCRDQSVRYTCPRCGFSGP